MSSRCTSQPLPFASVAPTSGSSQQSHRISPSSNPFVLVSGGCIGAGSDVSVFMFDKRLSRGVVKIAASVVHLRALPHPPLLQATCVTASVPPIGPQLPFVLTVAMSPPPRIRVFNHLTEWAPAHEHRPNVDARFVGHAEGRVHRVATNSSTNAPHTTPAINVSSV